MGISAQLARRFAPPLIVVGALDRRGARVRQVNPTAVAYAARAGLPLDAVYPGGLATIRRMAPPAGGEAAGAFVRTLGLPTVEVYPPFGGETVRTAWKWRWGWAAVGVIVGAALGGPIGSAVAGGLGALVGVGAAP